MVWLTVADGFSRPDWMNLSDENKSGNEIGNIHCVQANSEEERVVFSNEAQNGFSWFRMVGIAFVAVVGFTNLEKMRTE